MLLWIYEFSLETHLKPIIRVKIKVSLFLWWKNDISIIVYIFIYRLALPSKRFARRYNTVNVIEALKCQKCLRYKLKRNFYTYQQRRGLSICRNHNTAMIQCYIFSSRTEETLNSLNRVCNLNHNWQLNPTRIGSINSKWHKFYNHPWKKCINQSSEKSKGSTSSLLMSQVCNVWENAEQIAESLPNIATADNKAVCP